MSALSGVGLGLRPCHYRPILEGRSRVSWFEVISENYMGIRGASEGRPIHLLEKVRRDHPVVLHGVSMSIGSTDPLNEEYLGSLSQLIQRIQPAFVSDHICWTGVGGINLHDLLPLPFTQETLDHLVPRICRVQERLGRELVLENVSSYLEFSHSEMTEWEFLSELSSRSGCGLLLDINNVYVSSVNHGFDPLRYLEGLALGAPRYFHLAGHTKQGEFLIDTHDQPVSEPVWKLYETALRRFGRLPAMIERDGNIPELAELEAEVERAAKLHPPKESRRDERPALAL